MMKSHEMVDGIKDKADLVRFIEALVDDLRNQPQKWENDTLERYLDALARWLDASDWYYRNHGREVPVIPSWKNIGEMLIAAKMYE
jgi:pyruvate formate-lyase activating enzyme-like uncharacterized protein